MELIKAFPKGRVKPYLITQKGNVEKYLKKEKIKIKSTIGLSKFDNTRYGYYRGLRWLILLREIWYIYYTIKTLVFRANLTTSIIDKLNLCANSKSR